MANITRKVVANIAAVATTIKTAAKETVINAKNWGKDHKFNTVLIAGLIIIIAILSFKIAKKNNPEVPQDDNFVEVVENPSDDETSDEEPEVDVKSTYSGVSPQDKRYRDLEDEKVTSAQKAEEKVEGSKETFDQEDIKDDPESEKAKEDIKDAIEQEKVQEELESDPNKHVVNDNPADKAEVVGDDNTGKNPNTVEPEEENLPSPFDDVEDLVSEESKPQNENGTPSVPEIFDDSNVEEDESNNKEDTSDGVYDLFPSDDEEESNDVVTESDNVDDVIEDTTDDETVEESDKNDSEVVEPDVVPEENTDESVLPETESEDEDKTEDNVELPEDSFIQDSYESVPEVEETEPSTESVETPAEPTEEEKEAQFVTTYVVASGKVATLSLTQGKIISAEAGEGVNVSINGDTIVIELAEAEMTTVEVIMVDSLGNTISAIVAFNN